MQNDFEAPNAPVEREITSRGKSAKYLFTEPSEDALGKLYSGYADDTRGDMEKGLELRAKMIALVVTRPDGSPITVEEVGRMSAHVAKVLHKTALEVIGNAEEAKEAGNA